MGNATSMFNLMRNLGGSFGIASATTYLFRRQQYNTQLLGAHVQGAVGAAITQSASGCYPSPHCVTRCAVRCFD
jgi:hypothetical protein